MNLLGLISRETVAEDKLRSKRGRLKWSTIRNGSPAITQSSLHSE